MDVDPDECYRCPECDIVFVDDQIRYEKHLAQEHDYLRDTLPSVHDELGKRHF